ncbi:MAG: tetratricopeptide repeat protein [bacterium]
MKKKKFKQGFIQDKKEIIIVSLLLLIALILRLIYLSHLKANDPGFYNPPQGTDMLAYDNYAKQIINGTFSNKEPYYYGPLYFYFLALIYKIFGIDPYFPRLIQMMLGVFTTLLTYLIAKKVFNKTIGYISLIISILYAMFYIHEGVLLMESLVTFLNTLSVFLLLRIEDNPSYKNLALAGITLGLSALARANILLFIPFILVWRLTIADWRMRIMELKKFAFLCLITLLTISPATIRNYLVSGKFVPISTNGPVNLWIGNNPYSEGWFNYPPSEYLKKIAEKVSKRGDGAYIGEVLRFAKEYPKQFIMLLAKKFLFFLDSTEISNNINYELYKGISWIFRIVSINFGLLASLSLLGIIFSLGKKNLLLYLFILSFMLSNIFFFILARYRIIFIPILIPFAGFALLWFYEKIKLKDYKAIFLSLILLIFSISLTHSRATGKILAPYLFPSGFHIQRENDVLIRDDSGLLHGKKSYKFQSLNDMLKKELIIKEDLRRFKEACFFFNFWGEPSDKSSILIFKANGKEKETEIKSLPLVRYCWVYFNPNDLHQGKNTIIIKPKKLNSSIKIMIDSLSSFKRSYFNENEKWKILKDGEYMISLILRKERSVGGFIEQGREYFKNKMYDKAIFEFKEALKRDPDYLNLHYNLGLAYETKGKLDKAVLEYKKEIEISSKRKDESDIKVLIDTHNSLGKIYYEKGMIKQAMEECKNILAIEPQNKRAYNNLINLKKILDNDQSK